MVSTNKQAAVHPGWVVFALAMGGFAIGTTEFATMSLLPYFAETLHIDTPTAGHVISMYALGVVIGAPLIAVLASRVPRHMLLLSLMLLFTLGNAASAFAPSYGWMLLFRFISGLPHGAYFGVAALMAASLVAPERRAQTIGRMFLGLTVATIIGVPLANWLGQALGWRFSFLVVALLGLTAAALVALLAPPDKVMATSSPLAELSALRRKQVWLTLAIGAIGFGGLFAVYTYLASTLFIVTRVSAAVAPVMLAVFGIGFTLGNMVVPKFADRALMPTAGAVLVWSAVFLALFPWAAHHVWLLAVDILMIGIGGALATILQTRLMDVSGEAQTLPAALNHSAFNTANALGPWLAGMTIGAGYGLTSAGWVGCALALAGLLVWGLSVWVEKTSGAVVPVTRVSD